jgi:hypothetical protein
MKKQLQVCWVLVVLVALAGCTTPIGADKVAPQPAYLQLRQNALNSSRCSAETRQVLHRYGLEAAFAKEPDTTLAKLQAIACTDDRRDLLYALSELNFVNGDEAGAQQLFRLGDLCLSLSARRKPRRAAQSVRHSVSRCGRFLQSRPGAGLDRRHQCAG